LPYVPDKLLLSSNIWLGRRGQSERPAVGMTEGRLEHDRVQAFRGQKGQGAVCHGVAFAMGEPGGRVPVTDPIEKVAERVDSEGFGLAGGWLLPEVTSFSRPGD